MQVFSFVTGGSCLKRPSLAHVTSREYRITLPGSAQLLSKIVDLPGKVARRDHGRSVPAALKGNDDGQAFYGILDGTLVIKDGGPVAFEETAARSEECRVGEEGVGRCRSRWSPTH